MSEAIALMKYLMKRGVRVIMFCKVRGLRPRSNTLLIYDPDPQSLRVGECYENVQ